MTLPSFRSGGGTTGTTVPLSGASVGDLALVVTNSLTVASVTGGGTWKLVATDSSSGMTVWAAVLTANTGNATLNGGSPTATSYAFYRDCLAADLAAIGEDSSTVSVVAPASASVWDEALIVACGRVVSGTARTWTAPSGWTIRNQQVPPVGGNSVMLADMGATATASQDPTDPATFTLSVAASDRAGIMTIALSNHVAATTATATLEIQADVVAGGSGGLQLVTEIAFGQEPNAEGQPFWTDVSDRVLSAGYSRGRGYELAQTSPGTGSVLLDNDDGALDPTNSDSEFAPNVLPMRRIRAYAVWAGVRYPIWAGHVRTWPQVWLADRYAQSNVAVSDPLVTLNGGLLPVTASAMKASGPLHLWPFSETPSVPTSGDDVTWQFADEGSTDVPLSLTVTAPGTGAAVANGVTLPQVQAAFPADSSEGVKVDCGSGAHLTAFAGVAADGVSLFPKSGEVVTWEFFGSSQDASSSSSHAVLLAVNDGVTEWLRVETWESSIQFPRVTVTDSAGNTLQWPVTSRADDAWNVAPGLNRHWVITLDGTGGVLMLTVVLDGTIWLRQVVAPFVLPTDDVTALNLPGDDFVATRGVGVVSCAAMYDRYLGSAQIADHISAYGGHAGDTTGARAARLLMWADWNGPASLDDGDSTMQAASGLGGSTLQSQLQQCADTDFGQLYPDASGKLVFAGRARLSTVTASATLGDNSDEIGYEGDLEFDFDATYVYDRVAVSRTNGTKASRRTPATATKYAPSTLSLTIYSDSDADAFAQAEYLASQYAEPRLRLQAVSVNMTVLAAEDTANSTDKLATLLGLDIGDVVTVTRRGVSTVTGDFRIQQVADNLAGMNWVRAFQLSPVLDAPTW